MNEYSDDFKGVRFPKDLWLDKNISLIEKGILVVIRNLDKSDDHCWATNNYLADFFQCSARTIIRAVGHLKELGYIEEAEGGKTGVCRKLKVKTCIEDYPGQNDQGIQQTRDKMSGEGGQNVTGGVTNCQGDPGQNDHLIIYNNSIYNNINNNIGEQKKFSNADALPASDVVVDSKLDKGNAKKHRKTKKQQRYDEVLSSVEFNALLHEGLTEEKDIAEIDTLWSEFVDLRCSKDYRALTDGAVKRNLNVLAGTTFAEKKAILEKAVKKGWTGLYPLSDYDKQQTQEALASVEGSDERLYKKIFDTNCKEKEDEVSNGTTHNLLMQLCETYGEDKIKQIYYDRVKPKIVEIYGIKRDWK